MKKETHEKETGYFKKISHFYGNIFNKKKFKESETSLRDTIEELIEEDNDGAQSIESDERDLIVNVLNLRDLTASDVMVPHCDIIAASINSSSEEIISLLTKHNISVLPIYIETIDNIIGVLSMKDALILANEKEKNDTNLKDLIEEVCYIAPSMRILDLLLQMRETGMKLGVVVDEYGGVYGVVTFANLVEEIIGDIQYPENFNNENQIKLQANGTLIIDARTTIDELDVFLEENFIYLDFFDGIEVEDIETIGGLIMFIAGRVPTRGELIKHKNGCEFEILESDLRKINKIAIHKIKSAAKEEKLKVIN